MTAPHLLLAGRLSQQTPDICAANALQIHGGYMHRLTRERTAQLKALIETGN